MKTALPRTVIMLGLVSLLTDFSSEMIYPLLPLYLATVLGASAASLGLIEGVAESTASFVKVYAGSRSDRSGRRKPLVVAGYGLSNLIRPLIGLATAWPMVLGLRFVDRIGKGLRGAPRDALIADVTPTALRGHSYGLRQAMDHTGAVLGPLVAALLLSGAGLSMRTVFLLSIVPGVLVLLTVTLGVREPASVSGRTPAAPGDALPATPPAPMTLLGAWGGFSPGFRRYLGITALFTLGNSTDAFLLIQLNRQGLPPAWVATLWAAFHVVKVVATMGLAGLSDRVGRRPLLLAGWGIYALVYLGFATVSDLGLLVAIFLAYGVYFGCAEATQQAWVADLVPAPLRGSAFGYFHGAVGLTALPASVLFGALLDRLGAGVAFGTGAALALLAAGLLFTVPRGGGDNGGGKTSGDTVGSPSAPMVD